MTRITDFFTTFTERWDALDIKNERICSILSSFSLPLPKLGSNGVRSGIADGQKPGPSSRRTNRFAGKL